MGTKELDEMDNDSLYYRLYRLGLLPLMAQKDGKLFTASRPL